MIKVQTLRLRGLCASSLLALAACSGTPSNQNTSTGPDAGFDDFGNASAAVTVEATNGQDPKPQDPAQDPNRRALVQQAVRNARQSFERRLFEDARNEAAFALELDNQNQEARDILRRANEVLGDRIVNQHVNEVLKSRIAFERERTLVEKDLEIGQAYLSQANYQDAIDAFERALVQVRFSAYFEPTDPLRREIEARLSSAREAKREADRANLDAQRQASQDQLDAMTQQRREQLEVRVNRLLQDANLKFQDGQYGDAIVAIDKALMLSPANQAAIAMRDLADRANHTTQMDLTRERWRQEWNATIQELQQSNIPQVESVVFDPVRWAAVSERKPASFSTPSELDDPADRAVREKLEQTVIKHVFPSATVQAWAAYYANLTGVTFVVSTEVADMSEEDTTLVDFRLSERSVADALEAIQTRTGVAYRINNGLVQLVSPENAIGNLYYDRYRVSDLVEGFMPQPGPDLKLKTPEDDSPLFPEVDEDPLPAVVDDGRLTEILKASVAPEKWEGSPFTMNYQAGMLLVRADKATHEALGALLADLKRHVGIQIDVEARFLKVEDNFLEDVGVDLRGLGNQAAQGLGGRGLEKLEPRPNAGFDDFGPSQQQNPATPGVVGTGTEPGIFFNDGNDGDIMGRVENLYDRTLGGRNGALSNAGGLSLQYAFLDDTEVEAVLRAVSKQERSEQIEAPRLLIYNNNRSHMSVLRQISYIRDFEVEIAQAAAVANPVVGTVYDGVALDVRPVVDADLKYVTMELRPTVMSLDLPIPTFTTTLGVGQPISIQLPRVRLQRVRTIITLPDGGTMMLGGMRLVERMDLNSGVPVLKDLPGLSFLFSRKGTSLLNRKILILISANIVVLEEHEPDAIPMPDGSILTSSR
jgi:tetratricopeptide (TPR) repeat protein